MKKLIDYLRTSNIEFNDEIIDKFESFFIDLIEWNNKFNLTTITEKNDVIVKHFIDSLTACQYILPNSNVIDIGAGAGFPTIPLALVMPLCHFDMVDSLNKRVGFLDHMISSLSLSNICAFHARAEEFITGRRASYDFALARALAPLPTLIEYLAPYVKVGGKILAYKGSNYNEELLAAKRSLITLGCEIDTVDKICLDDEYERTMIVIKKIKPCMAIYPRGGNRPRIAPLI